MQYSHANLDNLVEKILNQITKAHHHIIETVVLYEAKSYGVRNLPTLRESSMDPYVSTIQGAYISLKKDVSVGLQGGIQANMGAMNIASSNEKIQAKRKEIEAVREKLDHKVMDKDRIHCSESLAAYQKQRWILELLAIGEVIWTMAAFLKLGDIVIVAAALGVVIGIAQVSATKTAEQIIKEIPDRRKRKFYFLIGTAVAIIFSFAIGLLRYWFSHIAGQGIPLIFVNPLTFTLINLLFISATALIVFFYYPSKAEIKKLHQIEAQEKEIEKIKKIIEQLKSELTRLMEEREFLVELRARAIHSEKKLLEKIDAFYQEAIGTFKSENTAKRPDHGFPIAFQNSYEPLSKVTSSDFLLTDTL